MNGVVRNLKALSIETQGQVVSMTPGQKALLMLIRKCVESGASLDFEAILEVYYNNVRKKISLGQGWYYPTSNDGSRMSGRYAEYITHDIMECWKTGKLVGCFKPNVRQWFVATIGILVVKNQLVIIPTINLDDDTLNP